MSNDITWEQYEKQQAEASALLLAKVYEVTHERDEALRDNDKLRAEIARLRDTQEDHE